GATSGMPAWLLEGFADYVALRDTGIPVATSGQQILARVRQQGTPRTLPTAADFAAEGGSLGATYESAWLACRLVAVRYGEDRLVALYRRAERDPATRAAFQDVLGTSQQAFTRSWRSYLVGLASRS